MKKCLLIVLVIGLLAGACTPEITQAAIIPTETKFVTSMPTVVSSPTLTPTVVIPTLTTIPTIPTIMQTFDVSSIVTVTPAEKADCPIKQPAENPNFDFLDMSFEKRENRANAEVNILNFLNTYGADILASHLKDNWSPRYFSYKDLTNDNAPEFAIGVTAFYVFGCKNGRYEKLLEIPPDGYLQPSKIFAIKDNNRNGIPEMTLLIGVWSQGGHAYQIYEWNGKKFYNLVLSEYEGYPDAEEIWVEATGEIHYEDIDHDLLNELILNSGIPVWETYISGFPWRNKRTYYEWNGRNYIPAYHTFTSPEFRFQAIQDADLATNQSEFDKALSLYQDAIFSDKLADYSPEIHRNLQEQWMIKMPHLDSPTPTPHPNDPAEYPQLAAYAYYRIMLLHLARGYESDAMIVFNTLQQKFPEGNSGHPYVEMANAFMKEYQSIHNMTNSCTLAIQYAAENPEILVPLGSDYHGRQSHTYKPEDVCLYR